MAQLVIPNAVQVRLKWTLAGGTLAYNVMTAQSAGGTQPTQALTNTIGSAIKSALTSSTLVSWLASSTTLTKVGLRWIGAPNFVEYEDSGAGVVGTAVGDALPKQTAFCVTIRTALAGRSYRGRIYLPGFAETANMADGTASLSVGTAAASFVNSIGAALASSGYTLGVGSRFRAAQPSLVPPILERAAFFTPYTTAVARDNVWDTQRRRRT